MTTVHRGRWSLEDRLEQGLRELPFDVPPGTASVTVELSHEGGVIDLGCPGLSARTGPSSSARTGAGPPSAANSSGYRPGTRACIAWRATRTR
ncbi:hypothetical protein SAMN05443665_102424 [Actinomadura meyerae]|jgi:hypothetical protein|uniref:Uncharacterized protein n=1 Tax=Actinomadura meyerae TaxID=240840 RepID=A0A239LV65_9ACTN|nr:hypothetical protein [Actinomadura meyerae]SNT33693.1 hypothetical protein SAMN05443665_102424 [Actinomadura meyerae]